MRIIARKTLRQFWELRPDVRNAIEAWDYDAKHEDWKTPATVKAVYRNASILRNNRVVFNLKGNRYRLVVAIQYELRIVYIRFIGSHPDYDKIDAETV